MSKSDSKSRSTTTKNIRDSILYHLRYSVGTSVENASEYECQLAVALAARDIALDAYNNNSASHKKEKRKKIYYLSLEFLIGRLTHNNISNLGLNKQFVDSVKTLGWELNDVLESEPDPSLGNGGLGRLAACFLDSMATLGYAGYGYGINYDYGLFRQTFVNGHQMEYPDDWKGDFSPWQIAKPNSTVHVPYQGKIEYQRGTDGNWFPQWVDWKILQGVPYDMPIVGYGENKVNYLRLFSAKAPTEFDMATFNSGDYISAVEQNIESETISKVLYPSDNSENGKKLRLLQEYFFVACAIRDITNQHVASGYAIDDLSDHVAIQLNDTHPALAVAELMRYLVDERSMEWEAAWSLTQATLAYTNHTLLPEALEQWPVRMIEELLPRHCQIIMEINHRFLNEIRSQYPGDEEKLERMSIIAEGGEKQVRMANLSIVGSHSVNGVAQMHTDLIQSQLVPDFYQYAPTKFNNKTNGITQRRWLLGCNPALADLISDSIGSAWITDLDALQELNAYAENSGFQQQFADIKHENKKKLAEEIYKKTRIEVDTYSIFDVQIKRIHEYKRQMLNALHITHLYYRIKEQGERLQSPRTFIFSGKAAPGYHTAKLIVKYINSLATTINHDPQLNDQIKVVFFPDYRVSVAEKIIPAADLSEQISTAGFEASGTGNMKLALNGAITVGTLDGANVEIAEEVGEDNIYIFGHTADELQQLRSDGYNASDYYQKSPEIRRVIDSMKHSEFCPEHPGLFNGLVENLVNFNDYFMCLADFDQYLNAQKKIDRDYMGRNNWLKMAIANVAGSGKFSSDRTIREYAKDIWGIDESPTVTKKAA